jgi:putative ABC transport system ATP-binding protein
MRTIRQVGARTGIEPHSAAGAPLIRALSATKIYGAGDAAVCALDDVDLELPAGGFTAVMGPSGSGKSTLMHCLAGLDRLTSGQVFLGGTDLGALSDRELTVLRREQVGFVFQSFNLLPALSAADNIALPSKLAKASADPAWLDAVIEMLGISDRLSHRPAQLSGGEQQRVAVARALAVRPRIVFADEPTGNLDSRSGALLLGFLRQAVRTLDQTILMVTHDPVAAAAADSVVFLADGHLAGRLDGPTPESVAQRLAALDDGNEPC